jgi:hypothetical protein
MADFGVTAACQDDAKELQDKMRDKKDDYAAESRRKAKKPLVGRQNQSSECGKMPRKYP